MAGLKSGELHVAPEPGTETLIIEALKAIHYTYSSRENTSSALGIVRFLEQKGWPVWSRMDGKDTFDYAINVGNPLLVEWLYRHPGAPEGTTKSQWLAAQHSQEEISPLFRVSTTKPEVLRAMISLGYDPNARNRQGDTLLHRADNPEMVRVLLDAGVDPQAVNDSKETALDVWNSKKNIIVADRREMEALLAEKMPVDPASRMREFGDSIDRVGVQQAKQRLSEAGLDPRTMEYGGLSPVEMVICEAIKKGMKKGGYRFGNPGCRRKWRKHLVSVMKMQGSLSPDDTSERAEQIRDSVALYLAVDQSTVRRSDEAREKNEADRRRSKGFHVPEDTTREDLVKLTGMPTIHALHGRTFSAPLSRQVAALGRLQQSGLLTSGMSLAAAGLLAGRPGGISNLSNTRGETELNAFNTLIQWATRLHWDDNFAILDEHRSIDREVKALTMSIDGPLQREIVQRPGGLGALILLACDTRPGRIEVDFTPHINETNTVIAMDDLWLAKAIEKTRTIAPDFSEQLRTVAEANTLKSDTTQAAAPTRTRRM